jgi:hypothetical protein
MVVSPLAFGYILIGMGIISWPGQFSGGAIKPPISTGHIHFWWDMGVVAVFSLVIYFWAMATRLPREKCSSSSASRPGKHLTPGCTKPVPAPPTVEFGPMGRAPTGPPGTGLSRSGGANSGSARGPR